LDLTEGTIAVCEPGGEPTLMAAPYLRLKRRLEGWGLRVED